MRIFAIVLFVTSLGWTPAYAKTCTQIKKVCLGNLYQSNSHKVYCPGKWTECMKRILEWSFHKLTSRKAFEDLTHIRSRLACACICHGSTK
jgi:hypothetical protein